MLLPKSLRSDVRNDAIVSKLRRDFEKASKIQDVGEKMLAMLRVEHAANTHLHETSKAISERAYALHVSVYLGLCIGGAVAGLALLSAGAGVIGGAFLFGGAALGIANLATGFVESVVDGLARSKMRDFMLDIYDTSREAGVETSNMLKNNVRDIASSAHFSTIYDNHPETRDHFVKAFNVFAAKMDNVGLVPPTPTVFPTAPAVKVVI